VPLNAKSLCGSLVGCGEDNIDVDTGTGKHAHQGIDAEKINPSANEIADPRLRDAEQLGSLSLGELAFLDELTHLDHERRTKPKVLSFIVAEAEISEYIPA
jgi:hypothetical protein